MLRLVAIAALALPALLCRFTVRDVGFVDLGDPKYKLYAFVSPEESPTAHASLGRLTTAMFAETNVVVERIDPDAEEEHDAHRLLGQLKLQEFPTNVLVHPDGRVLPIPFGGAFEENGVRTLESVFHSPLRRRILDGVLARYCVVLLVEGAEAQENARVAQAITAAFDAIERVFDKMPKAVGDLPEQIVLPHRDRSTEQVLLWSLGIDADADPEEQAEPAVAVLFGRGRRFGPVLDGAAITKATVLGILANAGQSCECDLDRSWMRGPRMPMRWDAARRQRAVQLLGFDPENPLVKSEISGILARGPKGRGERSAAPTIADLLGSYDEQTIGADPKSASSKAADAKASAAQASQPNDADTSIPVLLWTLGGLVLCSIATALIILARSRRA